MKITWLFALLPSLSFCVVLMVPTFDFDKAVFELETENGTEITVVFSDEDHPNPILDLLYDIYRFFKWGRIADIETFYVKNGSVYFPDTFASVTSFFQTENLHSSAEIPVSDFDTADGNLVIYVNTWNHMFSNEPLAGIPYVPVMLHPTRGGRTDAEKIYSFYK